VKRICCYSGGESGTMLSATFAEDDLGTAILIADKLCDKFSFVEIEDDHTGELLWANWPEDVRV
jgi:hypothetical protein